jgi:TolB-like protein/Tfp pilus assembly protein PilF
MSFFAELKRRNVIRVGVLYLVSAWLLMQLTDVLSSLLPVPAWAGSLVVLLLVIGFFPTLIFAWVFELTPDGLKREADLDRSVPIVSPAEQRTNALITVLLIIAIGAVAVDRLVPESAPIADDPLDATVLTEDPPAESGDAGIDPASIAVLPFADLSQAQDQRYFTDGISEELLNVLVRVEGLQVASRTSSFGYRDTNLNVSTIGEELRVRHVLEGSVRKDEQRIRITAQLIDASTDKHLWSETYDRELSDIFTIQDEIANAIVNALVVELGVDPGVKVVNVIPATENLDAYELYLRAVDLFRRRASLPLSVDYYRQAIALDPEFARAWEGLAAVYSIYNAWVADEVDHDPLAKEAAEKAIGLDSSLSLAYAVLGETDRRVVGGNNIVAALANYERALANDPKNTTALLWRGTSYRDLGRFDAAIDDLSKCLEIDPGYLNCKQHLATLYAIQGDDHTALRLFEEAILVDFHGNDPDFVAAYLRTGQRLSATLLATSLFPALSQPPVSEWLAALENPEDDQQSRLAQFDRWSESAAFNFDNVSSLLIALKAYDRINADSVWTTEAMWLPESAEYRQSDAFQELAKQLGLLQYWQSEEFPAHCEPVGEDGFRCD